VGAVWDEPTGPLRVALGLLRAQREGQAGLARRQDERLAALVQHARARSRYYERLYRGLPVGRVALGDLPPVTKPELMASFDDWLTDPAVTREGVEELVADPTRIGSSYLGRYFVCSTSGTTGHPGLFVHDSRACNVYQAMTCRVDLAWLSGRQWLEMAQLRGRWAAVVGTGGHFGGEGWMEFLHRRGGWRRLGYRVISVQWPLTEIVAELNAFDPAVITGYPSALELLAEEQVAGRLRVRPVLVELGGESVDDDGRARIGAALGGALHDAYAASEFLAIAVDCEQGWLHVNSDWVILEPVDAGLDPTPAGEASHTVLLTNLANRVQPIIRYDLGDSVLTRPDRCPCGSPFPAVRVQGRRDDVLRLRGAEGMTVSLLPLAIGSVIDETPGVHRSQLVQTGPTSLRLRLGLSAGAKADEVWDSARANLAAHLTSQGLAGVEIVRASEAPATSATSGKFRQVIAAPGAAGT
jgi:phenylacetate-coenzyme A ligase PaaK-like adenylate-forming protein